MLQLTQARVASPPDPNAGGSLRILHVVPTYFPAIRYGGPIRSVHALARATADRGHDVHVFTSSVDGPGELDVPIGEYVLLDGVKVTYFRVPLMRRIYWCPSLARSLRPIVDSFDIVHLHSTFLWPTWAAARIAHGAGVPYVLSPRGMLGAQVIRRKSRWIKTLWIRLIEKKTLREASALHVTSQIEAGEIAALGLNAAPLACIPNGVSGPAPRARHSPSPCGALGDPYALFLSRIDRKKGLDRLIESWKWVPRLRLVVAGNDERGYRRQLERMADLHGVRDRIQFIGPVDDAQKWPLYEMASIFVLPSYSENFGNVVAEAMSAGCPVVVTPEVGLAELVSSSGAGVVCEGEPKVLAAAITKLMDDAPRRRLMGERGRYAARRLLSWESIAGRMEQLYLGLRAARVAERRSAA